MRLLSTAMFGLLAAGQTLPPYGVVRATFLSRDGTAGAGELAFRTAGSHVFRCNYDDKTYFERREMRILPTALGAGDPVELVTDRASGGAHCYVRLLRRLELAERQKTARTPLPHWTNPTEDLFPRGNLTYAGVVRRVTPEHLVLRVRGGEQKNVLLRDDTRFLDGGARASRADLLVNTRVFVRAGTNLDGDIEAYQVIWGEILNVR